jgi:gamma-glutamylaminecyclotransferase
MPKPAKPKSYYIFVYGTLKRGQSNHSLLAKAEYLLEAATCEKFRMFHVGFPVLLADVKDGRPVGRVQGEVYKVSEEQLRRLDGLESEGSMYKRLAIDVTTDEGELLTVLAYIGIEDFWTLRGLSKSRTDGRAYGRPVVPVDGLLNWSREAMWKSDEMA